MPEKKAVLAMYDVRGIQKYIFRTSKIKDAIGASRIVENIITDALEYAVIKVSSNENISVNLIWKNGDQILPYKDEMFDICVLYIGGGNAFVTYSSEQLCVRVNQLMSYYVIRNTYSLQLAVAYVTKTKDYKKDYKNIYEEMNRVKQGMVESRPLMALPVAKIDQVTGYPLTVEKDYSSGENITSEDVLKRKSAKEALKDEDRVSKILDNYITKKGIDSTLAVIHIDGNNMGSRIKQLISNKITYEEAVPEMRKISNQIDTSYKNAFQDMKAYFNEKGKASIKNKENDYFVRKILVAGDDITYVCNGKIAIETIKYFVQHISKYTMNGKTDSESIIKYGFSVCAGVAFIHSHFPFEIGYEVAESVCENAKKRAKEAKNMEQDRIGNWMDFQVCKNVHVANLELARENEYVTVSGEELMLRPWFVPSGLKEKGVFAQLCDTDLSMEKLLKSIQYLNDKENIPRSIAKSIRNTYSLGEIQMNLLVSFIKSRNWKMPDGTTDMYIKDSKGKRIAKWYDALELMDLYSGIETEEE